MNLIDITWHCYTILIKFKCIHIVYRKSQIVLVLQIDLFHTVHHLCIINCHSTHFITVAAIWYTQNIAHNLRYSGCGNMGWFNRYHMCRPVSLIKLSNLLRMNYPSPQCDKVRTQISETALQLDPLLINMLLPYL